MKWLLGAMAILPIAAHAEQTSVLCKTLDTNEYIDIVSKGPNTNDVLFQVQGGKYFDGFSSFDNPIFKVVVPFDDGATLLFYNVESAQGAVAISRGNEKQKHEIKCVFR